MAYGDKLFEDGVEHIENAHGRALCGYPDKGYIIERKPGLVVCSSCKLIHERDTAMLERWNGGSGLENKQQQPYIPGTAWNWNSQPGFDKNKNRKRR